MHLEQPLGELVNASQAALIASIEVTMRLLGSQNCTISTFLHEHSMVCDVIMKRGPEETDETCEISFKYCIEVHCVYYAIYGLSTIGLYF